MLISNPFQALEAERFNSRVLETAKKTGGNIDLVRQLILTLDGVRSGNLQLCDVDPHLRIQKICLAAVHHCGMTIMDVPLDQRTPELCLAAVTQNGEAVHLLNDKDQTADVCLAAVRQNGTCISMLKSEQRTPEICLAAVTQNPNSIGLLGRAQQTPDLCTAAVMKDFSSIRFVPKDLKTPQLFCSVLKQSVGLLVDVVENMTSEDFTTEVCNTLVEVVDRSHLPLLREIPKWIWTPEICHRVIERQPNAIGFIPMSMTTSDLCMKAVRNGEIDGSTLAFVPRKMRTADLCLASVARAGLSVEFVPEPLRLPELCKIALANNRNAIKALKPNQRSTEVARVAVEQNGFLIRYVPKTFVTPELCKLSVSNPQMGPVIRFLNSSDITRDVCLTALENTDYREDPQTGRSSGGITKYIADEHRTSDVCAAALHYEYKHACACLSEEQIASAQQSDHFLPECANSDAESNQAPRERPSL